MVADNRMRDQMEDHTDLSEAKHFLSILVKRLCILLLIVSFASFFFWAIGNFSDFLDTTQLMLLRVQRYASLSLVLFSLVGILTVVLGIPFPELRRPRRGSTLAAILGYLVLVILGLALALVSHSLAVVAAGVG